MGLEHQEEWMKWKRQERSDELQERLAHFLESSDQWQKRSEQRQERLERKQERLEQKQELLNRDTLLSNKVGRRINRWILAFAIIASIASALSILSQIFGWF